MPASGTSSIPVQAIRQPSSGYRAASGTGATTASAMSTAMTDHTAGPAKARQPGWNRIGSRAATATLCPNPRVTLTWASFETGPGTAAMPVSTAAMPVRLSRLTAPASTVAAQSPARAARRRQGERHTGAGSGPAITWMSQCPAWPARRAAGPAPRIDSTLPA